MPRIKLGNTVRLGVTVAPSVASAAGAAIDAGVVKGLMSMEFGGVGVWLELQSYVT